MAKPGSLVSCGATPVWSLAVAAAASLVAVAAIAAPQRRDNVPLTPLDRFGPACRSSQRAAGGDARDAACEAASVSTQRPAGAALSPRSLAALVGSLCAGAVLLVCLGHLLRRRLRRSAARSSAAALLADSADDFGEQRASASSEREAPGSADDAAVEPGSPPSSDPDSPKPLRSALKQKSAVLAAARAREAASAQVATARAGLDSGVMAPFNLWQAQQGLTGRTLTVTLFPGPGASSSDDDDADDDQTAQVLVQQTIGRGRYGEVLAASWPRRGAVVIKAMTLQGAKLAPADVARAAALRHPNLLRVLGFVPPPAPPLLLMRLGACGSLAALLRADADADAASRLGWPRRAVLAAGVASGLAYLHAQRPPLPHGDVKPANVMLDADLQPRLADAGLVACRPEGAFAGGTPLHAAPEMAEGSAPADVLAADVYALGSGIVHSLAHAGVASAESFASPLYRAVYAAFEASAPEGGAAEPASLFGWDQLQVQFARSQAGWLPEVAPGCPAAMAAAIASCCTAAPAARPTAEAMRVEMAAWAANAHDW